MIGFSVLADTERSAIFKTHSKIWNVHCRIYLLTATVWYIWCIRSAFHAEWKPYLRLSYYFSLQFFVCQYFQQCSIAILKDQGAAISIQESNSPGSALPIQEPDLRVQHCQFKNPNPWTRKYKFWRGKSCNETHLIPWDIFSERHIYDHFQFHQPKKTGTWFQNQSKGYAN